MCKVSIITVTYNAQDCIEKTMRSVLSQRYRDFEYIIKDGNSSDNTNLIINNIIHSTSKNEIIKHITSNDKGIYDAMNEAVKCASGEWIIFMNAGDIFYDDNVLSDIFSLQYGEDIGVMYGHALLKLMGNRGLVMTYNPDTMRKGGSLCHQSVFEKKEYLIRFPFDTKLKILADRDHFLYLMKQGIKFRKVNIIVAKEDRNGISSVNYPQFYREAKLLSDRYKLNYKRQNIQIGKIKMLVKKLVPQIEEYVMINKALKKIQ